MLEREVRFGTDITVSCDVQVMLMNSKWSESQEKKIVLKESPACAAVFEVFLKYLYTGNNANQNNEV